MVSENKNTVKKKMSFQPGWKKSVLTKTCKWGGVQKSGVSFYIRKICTFRPTDDPLFLHSSGTPAPGATTTTHSH